METLESIEKIEVRDLNLQDFKELEDVMKLSYPKWEGLYWEKKHIKKLIDIFPKGQKAVVCNDVVVGVALSIRVLYTKLGDEHTYEDVISNYTFKKHRDDGDVLYGLDVFIHPDYRGFRLGRRLYDARKELCENLNLKSIIFGGRIPGYHKHAKELTPRNYIQKVRYKEIFDPILTFQLANDFHVKRVIRNYMPGDTESKEFAVLLEWNNIGYESEASAKKQQKSVVRLGLVQWQMRPYKTVQELYEQAEFFIDAVSNYKSDFAVFPEFFNAPLMAQYNDLSESDAIRKLAEYTEEIRDYFIQMAISYNVNIITGSMPLQMEDKLCNVGYLCRRDGSYDSFEKLHVTPDEVKCWGLKGGDKLQVYDTDCGKIGILICYDVEFPELPRLLAEEGMGILFVPFLTDTQNGYSRVRNCAQARAVENECYVAIAGSVGNLPKVHNMDIQFAQSIVFTPCDFAFPTTGVKAEATPNTEMILVADVDMDLLKELHEYGSVRNLKDRRTDIYQLKYKKKK